MTLLRQFHILITLALTSFTASVSLAQTLAPSSLFSQWQQRDGLIDNKVEVITQDSSGFIWLATAGGLSRFDGHRFVNYSPSNSALLNSEIHALLIDQQQRLWIASSGGLQYLALHTGQWHTLSYSDDQSSSAKYVSALLEDRQNNLWFANLKGELYRTDLTDESLSAALMYQSKTLKVSSIHACDEKFLYLTGRGSLKRFDLTDQTITSLAELNPNLPSSLTKKPVIDVACSGDDFWVLQRSTLYQMSQDFSVKQILQSSELENATFKKLLLNENQLWLATYGAGLIEYRVQEQRWIQHKRNNALPRTLPSDYINDLFIDAAKNLWLATEADGIALRNHYHNSVSTYLLGDSNNCLRGDGIYSLLREGDNIMVGPLGQSPFIINDEQGQCEPAFATASPQPNSIIAMLADEQNYWLGSSFSGLYQIDRGSQATHQITTKSAAEMRLPQNTVTSIHQVGEQIWLSTLVGLVRIQNNQLKLFRYPVAEEQTLKDRIFKITADDHNALWLGTAAGLTRFDLETEAYDLGRSSKVTGAVYTVYYAKDGRLWLAEEGKGLKVLNLTEDVIQQVDLGFETSIYNIQEDSQQNIWLATSKGLVQLNSSAEVIRHITDEFALQGNEFSTAGFYSAQKNTLDFVGENGLSTLHLEQWQNDHQAFALTLSELKVRREQKWLANDLGYTENLVLEHAKRLNFDHRDEEITLAFSALNYAVPKSIRYRYRLLGLQSKWIELDAEQTTINLSRLPAGDYQLQLNASLPGGPWHSQVTSVAINVTPPPWLTWWAKSLYVIAVLIIFMMLYGARTRQLRQRAKQLSLTVAERTQELQQEKQQVENLLAMKNYEFANVSHEFRTPLTLILGPVKKLLQQEVEPTKQHTLSVVKRNGYRLLRMVDQLIYMERYRALKQAKRTAVDLQLLLKLLVEAFADLCQEKGVSITLAHNEDIWISSAPDAVERIVINLLSNAYKYTPRGGHIAVSSVHLPDNRCRLTVRDSGIGIPQNSLARIFDRYERVLSEQSEAITGAGIGLSLVKELVTEHGGTITVTSEENKGSEFTVELPVTEAPADPAAVRTQLATATTELEGLREQIEEPDDAPSSADKPNAIDEVKATLASTEPDDARPNLLVIEDNQDMREYIVNTLRAHYQVATARDGEEGIALAFELSPDLIISDVMMPKKDGFAVCETLKQDVRTSHIPIILLTARGDRESRLAGWELNADEYQTKPFDEEELIIRVSNLLNIRSILRGRFAKAADAQQLTELQSSQGELNSVDLKFLNDLEIIVSTHFGDSAFNLKRLAAELALSERQLSRKVKAVINVTPAEYLRNYRLRQAEQQLRAGEVIKSVAFGCGFSSVSYFTTCFKAFFGVTPKQMQEGQ